VGGLVLRMGPKTWAPYILHTRPRSWMILFARTAVGYLLACGMTVTADNLLVYVVAAITCAVFGNGGGVALNSAFDRDSGDITYLKNPPPVPRHLARFGVLLMLAGLIPGFMIGLRFAGLYSFCILLGVLYSVPPFRFKTRPGLDVMTNALVYGSLMPYGGWAAMDRPLGPPMASLMVALLLMGWGFIPLNQIFQMDEDAARGDRTWALALGKKRTLCASMLAMLVGNGVLFAEVSRRHAMAGVVGFLAAVVLWSAVLVPWYRNYGTVDAAYEQGRMYQAISVLAVTDLVIILTLAV
jgi:4-hydroxybenzoate polyprenyltransferase